MIEFLTRAHVHAKAQEATICAAVRLPSSNSNAGSRHQIGFELRQASATQSSCTVVPQPSGMTSSNRTVSQDRGAPNCVDPPEDSSSDATHRWLRIDILFVWRTKVAVVTCFGLR